MRLVSRFESNLLHILHFFLERAPLSQALPLLVREMERPPCLSRAAVELATSSLAKGSVYLPVISGGWLRERFLCGERVKQGTLWQRHAPQQLGLTFSPRSLDFLMWVTATNVTASKKPWQPDRELPLAMGDLFLFYLAYKAVRDTEVARRWLPLWPFRNHGLCALMFAEDFGELGVDPEPDYSPWMSMPGAAILEGLQRQLARRWTDVERAKAQIVSPERMRAIGRSQTLVLEAYFDALDRAGRRDLARFLLATAQRILGWSSSQVWLANLDVQRLRVADRMDTYHAAFAFLRQLNRLEHWERQARGIGYLDEGYAASQLWKADWEAYHGAASCEAARQIVQQMEPLASR